LLDPGGEQAAGAAIAGTAVARPSALAAIATGSPLPPVTMPEDMAAPRTADHGAARPAIALSQAVQSAAARQNGLAPLFANRLEGAQAASLAAPVRTAIAQLAAFRTPTAAAVTADDVKQAFSRSGLFLETRMAATSSADAPAAASADLKAALVVFRQVLKGWLDTLPAAAASAGSASQGQEGEAQNTVLPPQPTTDPKSPAQLRTSAMAGGVRLDIAVAVEPEGARLPAPGLAAPEVEPAQAGK